MNPAIPVAFGALAGAAFPPEQRILAIPLGTGIGYLGLRALEESANAAPRVRKNTVNAVSATVASFLWYAATHDSSGVAMIIASAGLRYLFDVMTQQNTATAAPILPVHTNTAPAQASATNETNTTAATPSCT